MTVYSRQITQAKKQIAKKGALVPYSRTVVTNNPLKPWETTTTLETVNRKLVFLNLSEEDKRTVQRLEGSEVSSSYYKALMASEGFEPSKNDKIQFSGKTWSVLDMNILKPDGEIILTTFILKA